MKTLNLKPTVLVISLCAAFAQYSQANPSATQFNQTAAQQTPNTQVFGSAADGNPRPVATTLVTRQAGAVVLKASRTELVANATDEVTVDIQALNFRGSPLLGAAHATVEVKHGRLIDATDIDATTPATQIALVDGKAKVRIGAPHIQQDVVLRVTVGGAEQTLVIKALPHLRDMVVAGVVELRGHLNKLPPGGVVPVRENDLFEKELTRTAEAFSDERGHIGGRAAVYLKGKVMGSYLLTAMYDSDKESRGQMFRDIDPNKFYPVYGDASSKGVEAQSSGKLYVRLDKNKSYALYGDVTSQGTSITSMSNYNRSARGAAWHLETEAVTANVFASYDSLKQVVDEYTARGVSGPYAVSNPTGVVGSERVEIIVRDRNQPAVILRTTAMQRYVDYEFEPFNGRLMFFSPVASLDSNLNPVYIRVTYEIESGGEKFLVAGANAQVKVSDALTIAATAARDNNPDGQFKIAGVGAQVKVGKATFTAEAARSEGVQGGTASTAEGDAAKLTASYAGNTFSINASASKAEPGFSNPAGGVSPGRVEANLNSAIKVTDSLALTLEALHSEDLTTGGSRQGGKLGIEYKITPNLNLSLGVRSAKDVAPTSPSAAPVAACAGFNGYQYGFGITDPNTGTVTCTAGSPFPYLAGSLAGANPNKDVTSVHLKLDYKFAGGSNAYVEAEVSTEESSARMLAIGGNIAIGERARVYGRLEDISSASGAYGLTDDVRTRQGSIGVSADYMKDGQVFNEYRISDSVSGHRAENAIGLRNGFNLTPNWRASTNIEWLKDLTGGSDAKSVGVGLEYLGSKVWKGGSRLELRQDELSNNVLSTISVARKMDADWTLLARNYHNVQESRTSAEERKQNQFQVGLAYRPQATNQFNALLKFEHRLDDNRYGAGSREAAQILSVHTNYRPNRRWEISNRIAYKQNQDTFGAVRDNWSAWLVGGRVTYDVTERWSVGAMLTYLTAKNATQYGVAAEVGYIVAPNLMLNLGYNVRGLNDKDLVANDYRNQGWYFGLRFKFDENLFNGNNTKVNLGLEPPAGTVGNR